MSIKSRPKPLNETPMCLSSKAYYSKSWAFNGFYRFETVILMKSFERQRASKIETGAWSPLSEVGFRNVQTPKIWGLFL